MNLKSFDSFKLKKRFSEYIQLKESNPAKMSPSSRRITDTDSFKTNKAMSKKDVNTQ